MPAKAEGAGALPCTRAHSLSALVYIHSVWGWAGLQVLNLNMASWRTWTRKVIRIWLQFRKATSIVCIRIVCHMHTYQPYCIYCISDIFFIFSICCILSLCQIYYILQARTWPHEQAWHLIIVMV